MIISLLVNLWKDNCWSIALMWLWWWIHCHYFWKTSIARKYKNNKKHEIKFNPFDPCRTWKKNLHHIFIGTSSNNMQITMFQIFTKAFNINIVLLSWNKEILTITIRISYIFLNTICSIIFPSMRYNSNCWTSHNHSRLNCLINGDWSL